MLIPASTHTRYFHKYIWDKEKHKPKKNVEVRFLEKPNKGFNFGHEDGTFEDIAKGKVGYIKPMMIVIFKNSPSNNQAIKAVGESAENINN